MFTGWTVVAQLVDRCENPAARVFGNLADTVKTRETVAVDTPAWAAMSAMLVRFLVIGSTLLWVSEWQLFPYKCNSLHTIAKIVAETKTGVLQ